MPVATSINGPPSRSASVRGRRNPVPKKQQHAHPATRTGGALELPFRAALPATKCAGQAGREPGIRTAVKANHAAHRVGLELVRCVWDESGNRASCPNLAMAPPSDWLLVSIYSVLPAEHALHVNERKRTRDNLAARKNDCGRDSNDRPLRQCEVALERCVRAHLASCRR